MHFKSRCFTRQTPYACLAQWPPIHDPGYVPDKTNLRVASSVARTLRVQFVDFCVA